MFQDSYILEFVVLDAGRGSSFFLWITICLFSHYFILFWKSPYGELANAGGCQPTNRDLILTFNVLVLGWTHWSLKFFHIVFIVFVLTTGRPVGIYSAPLKQVVQKLPPTSSLDSTKFVLTLGDLMSTKTMVRTDIIRTMYFIRDCIHFLLFFFIS
jgi:hypothetical protein